MTKKIFLVIVIWLLIVMVYQTHKALPENVHYVSPSYNIPASDISFFKDTTYINSLSERESEQEIFDEVFRMIDGATNYILIDLFFYSNFTGVETTAYRQLATELTEKLVEKKQQHPDIVIQIITDPINTMYGGHISEYFLTLERAGIPVITTDIKPLRDSNPLYGAVWRTFFQWFGNSSKAGILPNPLHSDSPDLSIRTYLRMLNYKANHRKVVMTDYNQNGKIGFSTLITSANPHDGSSAHSNMAVRVDSAIWQDVLKTEAAVANLSGADFITPTAEFMASIAEISTGTISVQLLTEGAIEKTAISEIDNTAAGDSIDIAMFYMGDRDVIKSLKKAGERGVSIRLLLDPNKDAFGREKNGMPNRQVANELVRASTGSTEIRWCNTHGEQCHSKLLLITKGESATLMQGSANFTKRNLDDYNLETDTVMSGDVQENIFTDARQFFDMQWNNENEKSYSVSYDVYDDDSLYRTLVYRFKESSGLSRW